MREQRKQTRWLLTEVYSPPRVTACAKLMPSFRIAPGLAMDLTTVDEEGVAWDFDRPERREAARARIAREKPMFLIGSPMCTAFSAWQHLNRERRDPALMQREYNKAMIHLEFVCKLYRDQADAGRYFLHEHPVAASSWQERCVAELLEAPGVFEVNGDQCQYGQKAWNGALVKKPIGWMSNSSEVLRALWKRWGGQHGRCSSAAGRMHETCTGRFAKAAALYPCPLCRAILA